MSAPHGRGFAERIKKRNRLETLRGQLETERSTFIAHWKDLNDFILPRRARFQVTDVNRGDRRTQKIIDSTATYAARTLRSGLMSGVTSPARPWFRLTVPDAELSEQQDVKEWLHEVTKRMEVAFAKSNLYKALPIVYGDMGVFGTAAMMQVEDAEDVFRFYTFPIGSYCIANNAEQRVRVFQRTFRLTVQQVVERWGNLDPRTGQADFQRGEESRLSRSVQDQWSRGNTQAWIDICHTIEPNVSYDGVKVESRFKKYSSIYYEVGQSPLVTAAAGYDCLADEGFDEFPVYVPRWETNSEDVYGTDCPGMTSLGDIRQLQTSERRKSQAIEKMVNPPMKGPSRLKSVKTSILPGDITYFDEVIGQQGFSPVHEIRFDIAPLTADQDLIRSRIERAFFADLFLMLASMDRKEITATEIMERKEEKLLALGPVLEQLNEDLLDPLIDRSFYMLERRGRIPPAPDAMQGMPLRVEYISVMAQAQKAVGIAALERFAGFVAQIATAVPTVNDKVDYDELVDVYGEMTGVPPTIIVPDEQVAAMRQAKAQQAAQDAAAEKAEKFAGAASDLGNTPMGGDTALSRLLGKRQATNTLDATAQPPGEMLQ